MSESIKTVDVATLRTWMSAPESVYLLDVREPDEREAFNIGGFHIPLQSLPERLKELPQDGPIVVYCQGGSRSRRACEFLQANGYQVVNLIGGMRAFQE